MKINKKNVHSFEQLPSMEQLEDLIIKSPDLLFDLTLCELTVEDLDYYHVIGKHVIGKHINLDGLDRIDFSDWYAYHQLETLKITFISDSYDDRGLLNWGRWCINTPSLKTLILTNRPEWREAEFNLWLHQAAACRRSPLTLVIPKQGKGKKRTNNMTGPDYPMLEVFELPKKELKKYSARTIPTSYRIKKSVAPALLSFKGEAELEDDDWTIDFHNFTVDTRKSIVFGINGKDCRGTLSCEGRADWKEEQGGFYFARFPINYHQERDEAEYASLKISTLNFDDNGNCLIQGEWIQREVDYRSKLQAELQPRKDAP